MSSAVMPCRLCRFNPTVEIMHSGTAMMRGGDGGGGARVEHANRNWRYVSICHTPRAITTIARRQPTVQAVARGGQAPP